MDTDKSDLTREKDNEPSSVPEFECFFQHTGTCGGKSSRTVSSISLRVREEAGENRSAGSLYVGVQIGVQFGKEHQKCYKSRFADIVNGQLTHGGKYDNVEKWRSNARTSMFRTGLQQIGDDQYCGCSYNPSLDHFRV